MIYHCKNLIPFFIREPDRVYRLSKKFSLKQGKCIGKSVTLLLVLLFIAASCMTVKPAFSETDVTENMWEPLTPMHQARGFSGVAAVNGEICAIGGRAENGVLNTNQEYDPATDTWETKENM